MTVKSSKSVKNVAAVIVFVCYVIVGKDVYLGNGKVLCFLRISHKRLMLNILKSKEL